jgi:type II secretory ATPase GspE/PulE/Tfp pilus assembly ATPase PilB-like protein
MLTEALDTRCTTARTPAILAAQDLARAADKEGMEAAHHPWPALGALLLRDGLVNKEELQDVLSAQEDAGHHRLSARRLGELLVERGTVTHAQVAQLVAEQYELPYLELVATDVNLRAATLLSEDDARAFAALPISVLPDASVLVAVSDPPLVLFSDEFRRLLGVPLRYAVAAQDELDEAIVYALAGAPEAAIAEPHEPTPLAAVEETVDDLLVPDDGAILRVVPEHPRAHRSAALGALLVRDGLVTEDELDAALAQQRIAGNKRLGEILVERGAVTRTQVARLVAEQYDLPFVELDLARVDVATAKLLPESLAHRLSALPLGRSDDGFLLVAVSDPTNVVYADELHVVLDAPMRFVVVTPDEVDEALHHVHLEAPEVAPVVEPVEEENPWLTHLDQDLLAEVGEVAETAFEGGLYPQIVPVDEPLAEVVELPGDEARVDDPVPVEAYEDTADAEHEDVPLAAVHVLPAEQEAELDEPPAALEVVEAAAPVSLVEDLEEPEQPTELVEHVDDLEPAVEPPVALVEDLAELEQAEEQRDLAGELETVEDAAAVALFEDVTEPEEPAEHDEAAEDDEDEPAELRADAEDVVDDALHRALSLGATTVQLAPRPQGIVARCRIDGAMHELGTLEDAEPGRLTARLVARAGLDPSSRAPQYGLLPFAHDERILELAVTAVPTKLGTQVALRVPSPDGRLSVLSDVGLPPHADIALRDALRAPSGVVVVCGPALSGRTTTLHAALREVAAPDRAVATIEDPVDELVAGVGQVEVDAATGMTFARGLRTILRSDPDVVLVGDLRDAETAQVAFRGARAERNVLVSLEAPDALSALERLSSLGVDPRLLASTLSCVVAQSLVRRVCTDCRETYYASAEEIESLGRPVEEAGRRLLARGRGCESCHGTGYRGWAAVFETLPLTEDVRLLLEHGAERETVREAAAAAGMSTLRDEAVGLCLDGATTPAEVRLLAAS